MSAQRLPAFQSAPSPHGHLSDILALSHTLCLRLFASDLLTALLTPRECPPTTRRDPRRLVYESPPRRRFRIFPGSPATLRPVFKGPPLILSLSIHAALRSTGLPRECPHPRAVSDQTSSPARPRRRPSSWRSLRIRTHPEKSLRRPRMRSASQRGRPQLRLSQAPSRPLRGGTRGPLTAFSPQSPLTEVRCRSMKSKPTILPPDRTMCPSIHPLRSRTCSPPSLQALQTT